MSPTLSFFRLNFVLDMRHAPVFRIHLHSLNEDFSILPCAFWMGTANNETVCARSSHPQAKVGSAESKYALKRMAEAYHKLSHPEVEKLKAEAALQNAARQNLLSSPLSDRTAVDEASDVKLRASQVQRLNQSRLDVSLQQVTGHRIWNKGLGLADHVCALKPSFVSEHFGKEQHVDEIYLQHFRYDPTIEKMMMCCQVSCEVACGQTLGFANETLATLW